VLAAVQGKIGRQLFEEIRDCIMLPPHERHHIDNHHLSQPDMKTMLPTFAELLDPEVKKLGSRFA
jgi:hypothetical protein